MCWLTESYHICSHWGPRQVQTACIRGELSGSTTGCWENIILGVTKLLIACPSCRYRAEMETPLQASHFHLHGTSSDDQFELSADQERENAERKEREWMEELEERWDERLTKEAVGKDGEGKHEDDKRYLRHGKWFAWREFKNDELPKS